VEINENYITNMHSSDLAIKTTKDGKGVFVVFAILQLLQKCWAKVRTSATVYSFHQAICAFSNTSFY